jgi:hypothetical protein
MRSLLDPIDPTRLVAAANATCIVAEFSTELHEPRSETIPISLAVSASLGR